MTRRVVAQNLAELTSLLQQIQQRGDLAMLIASNTPQLAADREALVGEIARRLHNFLNSASSLVDHVRRVTGDRDTPSRANLERAVEALEADGAWPFVRNLRNYISHYELPLIGHTVRWGRTAQGLSLTDAVIELSKFDLLQWDGWRSRGKRFLVACDAEIPLLPLVQRVGQELIDLHARLVDDLHRENADASNDYNELVVRITAIEFGCDEESARDLLRSLDGHGGEVDPR